jgi:hypothetical protein
MHVEAQRVRQEWEDARRVRAENEAGEAARELRGIEEETRVAAVTAEESRQWDMIESERRAVEKERRALTAAAEGMRRREETIVPRERAAAEREKRATQLETEWETSEAALVHRGRNEEIRMLEGCLRKEVEANRLHRRRYNKSGGGGGGGGGTWDSKASVGTASSNISPINAKVLAEALLVASGLDGATSNRIGEGGFGRNGPVSPGMTRLRRAQSMIRHVLEGEAEPLAASWADGVEEVSETRVKGSRRYLRADDPRSRGGTCSRQLHLPAQPRRTSPRRPVRTDVATAEYKLRQAIAVEQRKHRHRPTGSLGGGVGGAISPTRSVWPPWKTWWRLANGNRTLSLGEFRHVLRRRAGVPAHRLSDGDVRRVYEAVLASPSGRGKDDGQSGATHGEGVAGPRGHGRGMSVEAWAAWWSGTQTKHAVVAVVDVAL